MTAIQWSDGAPIYRQLKERVIAMMLDGVLKPGDALPSVRQVAAEYQLNPITVSRAYRIALFFCVKRLRTNAVVMPAIRNIPTIETVSFLCAPIRHRSDAVLGSFASPKAAMSSAASDSGLVRLNMLVPMPWALSQP